MSLSKAKITYSNGTTEELYYEWGKASDGILHLYDAQVNGERVTRSIPLTSIRHYDTERIQ